jgi:hypothetical protein
MKILLQSHTTRDYVDRGGGWTWKQGRARKFASGLEAITFCFNQRIRNMQIVCAYLDLTKSFTVPITDSTGR